MPLDSFNVYHSYLKAIEPLSDAECGRLLKACLVYSMSGVSPELCGNERYLFPSWQSQIDRDKENYEARCQRNAKNASMRWHTTACDGMQTHAKHAKDKDKDKDKDKKSPPKSPRGDVFGEFAQGNNRLMEALKDFEDMRKQIKKPMTDKAKTLLVGKLGKLAESPEAQIAILQQSILHSWQDVYALKAVDEKKPIQRVQRHDEELSEFEKAAISRLMARHRKEEGNETGSA